jgi:BASS family bile acid:Na+ symporter
MSTIDQIKVNFNPDQLLFLNICLGFIMFGVALDLRLDNFRALLKRPRAPLVGLSSQLLLLPLITLALIFLFRPTASIALGMLLVSACPGGNVSNFAVHLSAGNTALSVLLTSISTLAAVVVTPIYFTQLAPLIPGTEHLQSEVYVAPINMVKTIVLLIIIPLAIGMVFNYRLPRITTAIKSTVRSLSMIIFVGFVIFAIRANYDNIVNYLHIVFLIVLLHNAVALLTGYWWGKAWKLPQEDARAISIETGIQNSGLALILIFNFFDGLGGMALIAAWWGIWHLVSAFSLAMWWQRRPIAINSTGG